MKNIDKKHGVAVVIGVVLLGASFYGGMVYSKQSLTSQFGNRAGGVMGGARTAGGMVRGNLGGAVSGQILTKDATSMTVKMQNGSTRLVLLGEKVQVSKGVVGSATDLTQGTEVSVFGAANADGSVTAQTVQIRLAGITAPNR